MAEVTVTITGTIEVADDDARRIKKEEPRVLAAVLFEHGKNIRAKVEEIRPIYYVSDKTKNGGK